MTTTRKRLLWLLATLALVLTSCSARPIRARFTAPAEDNAGTCTAPILGLTPAGTLISVRIDWSGPASGTLVVSNLLPGAAVDTLLIGAAAPGFYTITATPSHRGGTGCPATARDTVQSPPWRVLFK